MIIPCKLGKSFCWLRLSAMPGVIQGKALATSEQRPEAEHNQSRNREHKDFKTLKLDRFYMNGVDSWFIPR